ncbi:MAG: hypothetical protein FWD62_13010 [Betaproteobacteria bacterium]|nr:hypothetical protein [Betaproteobacteria bacterium]
MEADEAGRITRHYIYLDWQPIARIDIAPDDKPERYALHTDALGAVLAVTDEAAQLVWATRMEPFGTAQVQVARNRNGQPFEQDLRLPGQRFDPATNLSDNYYRTYDQASGRYLEPDPLGISVDASFLEFPGSRAPEPNPFDAWANTNRPRLGQGPNPYLYAGGNPLTRIDPQGTFAFILPFFAAAPELITAVATFFGVSESTVVVGAVTVGVGTAITVNARPTRNADRIIEQCPNSLLDWRGRWGIQNMLSQGQTSAAG